MNKEIFTRIRDWVEPAHPVIIERYRDIVELYKIIRDKYQARIDRAFDGISRQIGYVVTTTIPVILEVTSKGSAMKMGAEHLQGTLFDKQLSEIFSGEDLAPLLKERKIKPGTYSLYLVWFDALRLKLRTDWLEPVHFQKAWLGDVLKRAGIEQEVSKAVVRPDVREPAHWFDAGIVLEAEDAMLISAIDEVFPEIRLVERVATYRQAFLKIAPEVQEPAHFKKLSGG